jgi:hypothetical protein
MILDLIFFIYCYLKGFEWVIPQVLKAHRRQR